MSYRCSAIALIVILVILLVEIAVIFHVLSQGVTS